MAISAFAELKDMPSSSMRPRPPWQLNSCIAGDSWSRQGEAEAEAGRAVPASSSSPELSQQGCPSVDAD